MVSTLILFIVLFFSCLSYAGEWQEARLHMFSGGELTAACTGTCEIGYSTAGITDTSFVAGYIYCIDAVASANGTLAGANAKLYASTDEGASAGLCLYSNPNSDADPGTNGASNAKLSCTANLDSLTDTATTWASSAMDTGTSITSGTHYFICVIGKTANWNGKRTALGSPESYYGDSGLSSFPATLDLTGPYTLQVGYQRSMYVEIK